MAPLGRRQSTDLISQAIGGGPANGPSSHAVISGDRRFARVIAFQSQASDLVPGDSNGQEDVFAVFRMGQIDNIGNEWHPGPTRLISRTPTGAPANGRSYAPAVSGSLYSPPRCIAFLSAASNLVPHDTNRKADAFVSWGRGGLPHRLLLPGGRQPRSAVTRVAVSGDCSRIAFVSNKRLFVRVNGHTRRVHAPPPVADPAFSTGAGNDLVFAARGRVYLARKATGRPRAIARGSNPAYNDVKRHVVAYEVDRGGTTQIASKLLGHQARIISANSHTGALGDGPSRDPVIGNSGYYVSFETDATNLTTVAAGYSGDRNYSPDVYLYTGVRDITLVESVQHHGFALSGQHPSMSFYANYILFDGPRMSTPVPGYDIGDRPVQGPRQIYMRYLGGIYY
jgi:hypothetical protein